MDIKSTFANRLKELRVEKGLSQEDFGKEIGVSRGSISYYEKEERVPDIVVLAAVSKYFNVSTDYLLGISEHKSRNAQKAATCEFTGLSEKAAGVLEKWNMHGDIDCLTILNTLIEGPGLKVTDLQEPTAKYDLNLISKIAVYLLGGYEKIEETIEIPVTNSISNGISDISYEYKMKISSVVEKVLLDSIVDSLKTARKIISASKEGAANGEHN